MPALPLLLLTCRNASFKFARSHTSSMIRLVLAGRSGSYTTESDSMSSRNACRASPVGADEKSSLNWMFSRLSLSRFMSYLPLLSFVPSVTVPGSAYLLTPPFGMECLTSLCRRHNLIRPLLTSAPRSGCLAAFSVAEATRDRSPGVSSAAFRAQSPNLRFASLMDMDFAVRCPLVRRLRLVFGFCPSTHAFARCFLQTPPRGGSPCTLLALHLHQVGQRTFTSKLLSMPSTQRNRSRGRALRHGRASNRWNDESVLPDDDEGPEADCSA